MLRIHISIDGGAFSHRPAIFDSVGAFEEIELRRALTARERVDLLLEEIAPLDFHVERPVCLPIVD